MKTVINKTSTPLRVSLPGGKALHLGPRKNGQIRDEAVGHPAVKKMVADGKIEIVEGDPRQRSAAEEGTSPHEATHGYGKSSFRQKTGDR
jgi:hypothetical protein